MLCCLLNDRGGMWAATGRRGLWGSLLVVEMMMTLLAMSVSWGEGRHMAGSRRLHQLRRGVKMGEMEALWVRRGGYAPPEWRSGGSYYGDQDDEYDRDDGPSYEYDRRPPPKRRVPPRSRKPPATSFLDVPMPPALKNMGFTLLGASAVLTMVGISLFFERTLLRLGNLCFIIGLPLYCGPGRVARMLFAKEKLRATACFLLGVFLVLRGNSFLGMLLEIFGFFNLFGNMFPLLFRLLGSLPIVRELVSRPSPPQREPLRYPSREQPSRYPDRYSDDYNYYPRR